jgi:hypothetical protein
VGGRPDDTTRQPVTAGGTSPFPGKYIWERHFRGAGLSHAVKDVAWMLATYADGDGRHAHPGVARLGRDAEDAGRATVVDALRTLAKAGFIEPDQPDPGRPRARRRGPAADEWRLTIPHEPGAPCPHCNRFTGATGSGGAR